MFKPLKIQHPDEKVFFVSDLHYGHDKDFIWKPRGFSNAKDCNEALVQTWNTRVPDDGIVFHVGDFIIKAEAADFWALVRRLKFKTLYLLWGNHNSGQGQAYKNTLFRNYPTAIDYDGTLKYEVYPLDFELDNNPNRRVVFLHQYATVQVNKQLFVLCHFPIISHERMGHNSIHICGHSHGDLPLTRPDTGLGKRLDVGIESFGGPVAASYVIELLSHRDLDVRDHKRENP
jgi:calcineurin-like phosphoesterase family protein